MHTIMKLGYRKRWTVLIIHVVLLFCELSTAVKDARPKLIVFSLGNILNFLFRSITEILF